MENIKGTPPATVYIFVVTQAVLRSLEFGASIFDFFFREHFCERCEKIRNLAFHDLTHLRNFIFLNGCGGVVGKGGGCCL